MSRALANTGRYVWQSLALPIRVAGAQIPIGLVLNIVLALAYSSYSAGEKVLRIVLVWGDEPRAVELTSTQVFVALAFLVGLIGSMIWIYVRDVSALSQKITPSLEIRYREGERPYRQLHRNDPRPGEYLRVGIKNVSESTSIEGVRVRIETCEPDDGRFETTEPLEMMGAALHPLGRRVDPGEEIFAQVIWISRDGSDDDEVRIHYALEAMRQRSWPSLPSGVWDLTLAASGTSSPKVHGTFRLIVANDQPNRAWLRPITDADAKANPPGGEEEGLPF